MYPTKHKTPQHPSVKSRSIKDKATAAGSSFVMAKENVNKVSSTSSIRSSIRPTSAVSNDSHSTRQPGVHIKSNLKDILGEELHSFRAPSSRGEATGSESDEKPLDIFTPFHVPKKRHAPKKRLLDRTTREQVEERHLDDNPNDDQDAKETIELQSPVHEQQTVINELQDTIRKLQRENEQLIKLLKQQRNNQ